MYELYKICGIVIITVVLTGVLKSQGVQFARFLPQICSIAIISVVFLSIKPIFEFLRGIISCVNTTGTTLTVLFSGASIAVICGVIESVCKENGENMLASVMVLVGNAQIMLLGLPILKDLFNEVIKVLGK